MNERGGRRMRKSGRGRSEILTVFFCHHSLLLLIETSVCYYYSFVPSFLTSLDDEEGNLCLKLRCKKDWSWGTRLKERGVIEFKITSHYTSHLLILFTI
jgi:hypothetical protein